ncbi:OCM1 [Phytophthora palmivora]|uniref:OCM1 n=1 Tax=Phytophthora palmivora TaxID=4796 RepID=A0A2P4WX21_9STRA|nr:OCM1 [Phytophthora palmivora]
MGRPKMLLVTGLVLLAMALLSLPTSAECPNGCSGNGACMAKDMCNCYKNYQGNDCLDRTCQFGYAHTDTPKGDINMDQKRNTPQWILTDSQQDPAGTYEYFNPDAVTNEAHFYMECSNKGLCDRSLGTCLCFDGYEGGACQRSACPNKCSGRGTCESIQELGLKAPGTLVGNPKTKNPVTYDLWDSRVTYGCRCDPWYHGADCSLRSCKVGVDPMFLSVGTATYKAFALHVWLDATAYPTSGGSPVAPIAWTISANDYVRLRLFDYHGESYITDVIPMVSDVEGPSPPYSAATLAQMNADAVAAAIKKIPNQTFRDVLCEPTGLNVGTDLDGYVSTRTAATHGLSVVCQFTENPGRLRTPEIVTYNFNGVTDPTKKSATIITMEEGTNNEWFTQNSGFVVTGNSANDFKIFEVTYQGSPATETPTLFKLGPHVVVGYYDSVADKLKVTYGIKHTLGSKTTRFDAVKAASGNGGIAVTELAIKTGGVAVGATTIIVTASPAAVAGDLFFFENQFYNYVTVVETTASTEWTITLDRPFLGNALTGGANTILKIYKVTPPVAALQYNYVSECSGRGLCATDIGVCDCFKGYTNDNCDTQNILAL